MIPLRPDRPAERPSRDVADRPDVSLDGGIVLASGDPVGTVTLGPVVDGDALLWYEIDEPHRGRGYATRAVALVLGEAAHGGVRRVVAEVAIGNPASREVLQRNGFHVVETDGSILVGVDEEPALRYVRELDPTRPPVAGE